MEPRYYIGLDVHKRKLSYCVKDRSGQLHAEGSPAARRDLDYWMKTLSAVECGDGSDQNAKGAPCSAPTVEAAQQAKDFSARAGHNYGPWQQNSANKFGEKQGIKSSQDKSGWFSKRPSMSAPACPLEYCCSGLLWEPCS